MNNFTTQFEKYQLPIFTNGVRLPEIKITEKDKVKLGLEYNCTNLQYLKKLAWQGCLKLIEKGKIKQTKEECIERLKMEFEVFDKTGTVDYILLLLDIYLWCDSNDILRGPARGSAGAAFSFFCLGLNTINPLDFKDLVFTRFLSEARVRPNYIDGILHADGKSMCDYDGDVQFFGRDRLIQHVSEKYQGKVCKILTLQYLTGKTSLKDTVKSYLEYTEQQALMLGSHIETLFGKVDSLRKTYEKNKSFKEWADKNEKAFKIALKIEGLFRSAGVHASGIAVSYYPIDDILPQEICSTGEKVSGMDMSQVLSIAVKCDILGLRQLDLLKIVLDKVNLKLEDLDPHHPSIYEYLNKSTHYYGLFQIEDGLTKQATLKIKPQKLDHLVAILAISRPGSYKYIDEYAKFVQTGERKLIYKPIDDILESSGSVLLYQESINSICQKVYKLSATDADDVRRCIGKKDVEGMKKWEPIIFEKGKENNVPEDATKWFFQVCKDSADYLFNASHAASYSLITAYSTYLKANYPLEFFLACLEVSNLESDPIQAIAKTQNEMNLEGVKLLPPSLIKPNNSFYIEGKDIRMGLSAIRGISEKALEKIKTFNYEGENTNKFSLFVALEEAKLGMGIVTPLILSGCLDHETISRNKLLFEFEVWKLLTPREKPIIFELGKKYNYDLFAIIRACSEELKNEKGNFLIKESRLKTLRRNTEIFLEKYKRNSKFEELSNFIFESEYLGFSYSTSLYDIYSKHVNGLRQSNNLQGLEKAVIVGKITECEKRSSRKSNKTYLHIVAVDDVGSIRGMIWGEDTINAINKLNDREIQVNDIVILHISRKKDSDENFFYINQAFIQDCPIVIKKSEIKTEEINNAENQ